VPEGQPQPGTGLGLAIVKEIVEPMAERSALKHRRQGCVFSFSLPIIRKAPSAEEV
jgi:signal transduction histidine kinase